MSQATFIQAIRDRRGAAISAKTAAAAAEAQADAAAAAVLSDEDAMLAALDSGDLIIRPAAAKLPIAERPADAPLDPRFALVGAALQVIDDARSVLASSPGDDTDLVEAIAYIEKDGGTFTHVCRWLLGRVAQHTAPATETASDTSPPTAG